MIVRMTKTQFQVLLAAMYDRRKNADPPLNDFGNKLVEDMERAHIQDRNTVDLRDGA